MHVFIKKCVCVCVCIRKIYVGDVKSCVFVKEQVQKLIQLNLKINFFLVKTRISFEFI